MHACAAADALTGESSNRYYALYECTPTWSGAPLPALYPPRGAVPWTFHAQCAATASNGRG